MLPSLRLLETPRPGCFDLPLAGQVEDLVSVVPERHAHTRDGVEELEAPNWLIWNFDVPQAQLTVARLGESSGGHAVLLAHPNRSAVLRTKMALLPSVDPC